MKQKQTVPDAHTVEIYFGGPHKAAKSFILGQGFEPIGFDGEQMLVRRDWAERRKSALPSDLIHALTGLQ